MAGVGAEEKPGLIIGGDVETVVSSSGRNQVPKYPSTVISVDLDWALEIRNKLSFVRIVRIVRVTQKLPEFRVRNAGPSLQKQAIDPAINYRFTVYF